MPKGIIYEGVDKYANKPQKSKGETGAQSAIISCLDALLRITHEDNPLKAHLNEMRTYMPSLHREFLEKIEAAPDMRAFVLEHFPKLPELRDRYNDCVKLIGRFRGTHLRYAAQYIQKQAQTSDTNPTDVGTGGTPFMDYLRKHERETESHLI